MYRPWLAAPAREPSVAPASNTANVWPVTGTGVKGRGILTWAANAVSKANPTTSAAVITAWRGKMRVDKTEGE